MLLFVLAFIATCIFGIVQYARWNYGVLEKMGLSIDKPHFILGNTAKLFETNCGHADIDRFNRLGLVYGVYEGRSPQVHICDAELVRLVTSKDSEYFNDKRRLDFKDDLLNEMPDFQPTEKWRAIRNHMTPAFSLAKIKSMSTSMTETIDKWTEGSKKKIQASSGGKLQKFDLRDDIFVMITDLVAKSCFSIHVENSDDPNNYFAAIVRKLLAPDNISSPSLEVLSYSFPFLGRFVTGMFNKNASDEFKKVFLQIVKARRSSKEKKKDIVDVMIDMLDKTETEEFKRLNITETTVCCQAFVFFFAGQDQISTISACMIYYILKNPELEKRLVNEIDNYMTRHNGKVEHETLSELTFLTACLNESLRLVPFFSRTERVCTKDWKNDEFGLDIKKGMTVIIPIWAANRNPEHFPDPERFNPERFVPENIKNIHPYAFTSFGHGPRNCIGQKFSIETLLLLNVVLLHKLKFHLREDSKPVFTPGGTFFCPHSPFYFDVTVRNTNIPKP